MFAIDFTFLCLYIDVNGLSVGLVDVRQGRKTEERIVGLDDRMHTCN